MNKKTAHDTVSRDRHEA